MAEMKALLENLEEEVTCAICQDTLKTPKMLACLHTFCCECLKQFAQAHKKQQESKTEQKALRCPTCQAEIPTPETGSFDNLPTSFHHNSLAAILEIYDKRKVKKVCESCNEQKQVDDFYCFICGHICEDCCQVHRSLKGLKCHKVLQIKDKDISEQDIEALKQKQAVCEEQYHSNEPLRYYCQECHVSLCQICIIADKKHKNHEIQFLEQTADEVKRGISVYVDQLRAKQQACVTRIENIKVAKESLMVSTQNAKRTIEETCEQLRANLLLQERKALEQLSLMSAARDEMLQHDENSTNEKLRNIKDSLDLMERLLRKGTAFEVVRTQKVIENRVKELTTDAKHNDAIVIEILTFFPNDKNIELFNEDKPDFLGVLISSDECDPKQSASGLSEIKNVEATKEANFVIESRPAVGSLCSNKKDQLEKVRSRQPISGTKFRRRRWRKYGSSQEKTQQKAVDPDLVDNEVEPYIDSDTEPS